MQTFLPYENFARSAEVLDYRRLGRQRSECKQILGALENGGGWSRHPAALMWRGYEDALRLYMNVCIEEWVARGYRNTMPLNVVAEIPITPPWLGDEDFHASHRKALLRKNPDFYRQVFTDTEYPAYVPSDQIYWWPVLNEDGTYHLKKKGS